MMPAREMREKDASHVPWSKGAPLLHHCTSAALARWGQILGSSRVPHSGPVARCPVPGGVVGSWGVGTRHRRRTTTETLLRTPHERASGRALGMQDSDQPCHTMLVRQPASPLASPRDRSIV